MPLEGLPWLKREEILSYEEIVRVVRTMAGMGLERVRLTGGEPLVRRDLPDLVHMIAAVGYSMRAGAFDVPLHLSIIPDIGGAYRVGLTTGVNWRRR